MRIIERLLPLPYFLLMSAIVCSAQAQAPSGAKDTHRITIHVYNYVRIPQTLVAGAEAEATRVLSEAGVETVCLDCTQDGAPGSPDPACGIVSGNTHFVMNLVNRLEDFHRWVPRTTLGFSIVPAGGEFGTTSYVSVLRAHALGASGKIPEARLLGLAMAHELGHLLLGTLDHTYRGIMRASWPARYLENFDSTEFLFTRDQAKHVRASVLAREKRDSESARLRLKSRQP